MQHYHTLVLINTFKDGIDIDLDSSNIQNTPVTIFDLYTHVNVNKFNGQDSMKQTIKSFFGTNNNDEINPLFFNINKYMNRQDDIFRNYDSFIKGVTLSKYVKMNAHFFTYYNKEPFKYKIRQECFSILLVLFHFFLFPLTTLTSTFISNPSEKEKSPKEIYFAAGFFGIILSIILYFIGIRICSCLTRLTEYLRIDIIYSKNFDRLFIGIMKNDEVAYIKKFLLNINEIDKFVIQKNNFNEIGFHLKSINKGNSLVQDICYINDTQNELEGLLYILNEKLINNTNNNTNYDIVDNNNIDIDTNDFPLSTTPLMV